MDKDKVCKISALYIAALKAMALIHQNSHWLTRGDAFYGKHLLFERIYNSALKDLDLAAEKFVGLFGDQCLNYDLQTDLLHKLLLKYKNLEGSPTQMSLEVEKEFLKFSSVAYNAIEDGECLTLGLSDTLTEIASNREQAVYLLQQTLDQD